MGGVGGILNNDLGILNFDLRSNVSIAIVKLEYRPKYYESPKSEAP